MKLSYYMPGGWIENEVERLISSAQSQDIAIVNTEIEDEMLRVTVDDDTPYATQMQLSAIARDIGALVLPGEE